MLYRPTEDATCRGTESRPQKQLPPRRRPQRNVKAKSGQSTLLVPRSTVLLRGCDGCRLFALLGSRRLPPAGASTSHARLSVCRSLICLSVGASDRSFACFAAIQPAGPFWSSTFSGHSPPAERTSARLQRRHRLRAPTAPKPKHRQTVRPSVRPRVPASVCRSDRLAACLAARPTVRSSEQALAPVSDRQTDGQRDASADCRIDEWTDAWTDGLMARAAYGTESS